MGPVGLGSDPTGPGTDAPTPGSTPRVSERESDYPIRTPNGLRLIAQLRDRYLLCEGEAHLYLLDRHRADQAVRYEALREAMQSGPLTPQSLLFPDRVELGAPAQSTIARYAELLRSMGFEWSPLGERSHAVRSVPPLVGSARATSLFEEAIAALEQPGDDPADRVLHALARRAAAPDGAVLDDDDARALVAGLRLDREPYAQSIVARIALPGDHG